MSKTQRFVSDYTQAVTTLLQAADQVRALRTQYTALDLGNVIADADATGQELTAAQFIDGVAATDAVLSAITTNQTNLYRLKQ